LYLADGKYGLAETDFNQVLYAKPNSSEVHYVLAKLHKARGSALLQRQELFEALRLNPVLLRVRLELAQLLIEDNGAKTAIDVLDEAPAFQRQLLAVLVQRNWALWASGDLSALRKGIDQGLATARIPDLLIQDGLVKLRQGDPKGARVAVDEALRLDPSDLRALDLIRRSYVSQKQAEAAVQKVKDYVARSPRSAPAQEFLGSVLMASGDYDGARRAFETAKAVDPTLTNTELKLVQLDVSEKRTDEAQKRLEKLLTAQDIPLAHLWLGNLEEYRGDHERAIEQFRRVIEREPNNVQALNNLAYLLIEHNSSPDEALKYAEKATELAPDRLAVADTMGWILYRKGLYSSAVKHLERAAGDRRNVLWKYHLAMAYAKAGDLSRSRVVLKTALQTNPNLPEAKIARDVVDGSR
jgi:tetratricopeptide (TPR) repeat protein